MQVSIWNEYLKNLDTQMRAQGRNIILLVDNTPTHALYENTHLTNVTIEYLLPNTTAHLQPCDQGIINSFKVQYYLLFKLLMNIETDAILMFTFHLFRHNIESCY